ncbi:acyl-CoA dehydrogenase [Burkholderia sp. Bp9140]|uniref:acyl-CoA dehydrogenase family protein n=1 Tax=Burkholderia sp. Bp9140 TaxID=2184572 RepID=UPI000F56E827|nr:acyl-CoA dehydrogenase family protein [Burkholderia sp. Bp9140]RQR51315.1 acyl-CoA dehydrogenase [Burkholderia sp. Bp9140]
MNGIAAVESISSRTDVPVIGLVRQLLPEIEARSAEIEQNAAVPDDLLDKLEEAGAFRMCVPAMFGGEEMQIGDIAAVIEEVATVDASVAWHIMVAAGTQVISSRLPVASLREYYEAGPDVWAKAALAPKGIAVPVDGGYRLSGRWPLASGARPFKWICLGFFIKDENEIRRAPNGLPDFRFCLVPRGDAKIIETWNAVGLRGTRSDDLEVEGVFVPEDWQASLFGKSTVNVPILGISMPAATAPHHSAVVKGLLRGAMKDLAHAALTRKPAFNPTVVMKDDPVFQSRFGEIASRIDAICALSDLCTKTLDSCNREGRDVTREEAARISSAESLLHHEGTALMDQIMMLSGSAGIYTSNLQQRRWRDLRCAAQHQAANIGNYAGYARSLVDQAAANSR